MRLVFFVAMLFVSLFVPVIGAELDAASIALNCLTCHNDTGKTSAIPPLNKLSALQMQQTLLDFKYDKKPATLMRRLAKGYSDAELAALAEYLSRR